MRWAPCWTAGWSRPWNTTRSCPRRSSPGGSAHVAHAELDADPGTDRLRRLGYRVFPRALATAAHGHQVAVAELVADRRTTAARTQQKRPGRAERHDGHDGVLRA